MSDIFAGKDFEKKYKRLTFVKKIIFKFIFYNGRIARRAKLRHFIYS